MKKILIFLFFISIIACKKNENKEISFESIEISYINGFTASGGTIVIQKDGSILDYYQGYPFEIDSSFYLLNSLKNKELNIISKQLLDIMKIKIDTIYGEDCPDCSSTYVLIKTKSKTINSKLLHNSIDN